MEQTSSDRERLIRQCDHCEGRFWPEELIPVVVAGIQSLHGHLLTGKSEERRPYYCGTCFQNISDTSIAGLMLKVDEERLVRRGLPPMIYAITLLSTEEQKDLAGINCDGVGEHTTPKVTHYTIDSGGRVWYFCLTHVERLYGFELRRWRERQVTVA